MNYTKKKLATLVNVKPLQQSSLKQIKGGAKEILIGDITEVWSTNLRRYFYGLVLFLSS